MPESPKFDTAGMRAQLTELLEKHTEEGLKPLAQPLCDAMMAVIEAFVAGIDQGMQDSLVITETIAQGGNLQDLREKFKA